MWRLQDNRCIIVANGLRLKWASRSMQCYLAVTTVTHAASVYCQWVRLSIFLHHYDMQDSHCILPSASEVNKVMYIFALLHYARQPLYIASEWSYLFVCIATLCNTTTVLLLPTASEVIKVIYRFALLCYATQPMYIANCVSTLNKVIYLVALLFMQHIHIILPTASINGIKLSIWLHCYVM